MLKNSEVVSQDPCVRPPGLQSCAPFREGQPHSEDVKGRCGEQQQLGESTIFLHGDHYVPPSTAGAHVSDGQEVRLVSYY